MKLSFVIPAYNEENYIGECLRCVLEQIKNGNYDAEVIVVNNASTDKTKEISENFPEVRVVDEFKKGLVSARRSGYLASSGDLIANVDADTRLTPGWIDKVLSEFEKDEDLVALSGPYIYYDLSVAARAAVKVFYFSGYLTHVLNYFILRKGAMLQGGNFIVKRSAMEKIGGYNNRFDFYGEDTDIATRIQKIGKVKFTFRLPMCTSGRRLVDEGIITTGVRYSINYFWTMIFKRPFSKKYRDIR